jgi:hypothetical protein
MYKKSYPHLHLTLTCDLSLVDVQTIGVVVTATSVTVAAFYYIMMLRMNQKALRLNMTNSVLTLWNTLEGVKIWGELLNMNWTNYEDFERKYGSDYNLDNFSKRMMSWNQFETMGNMLKSGLLDRDTLYGVTSLAAPYTWAKFSPIMDEWRKRYSGMDAYSGFEYLASEMLKMKHIRDPKYKVPESLAKYIPDK